MKKITLLEAQNQISQGLAYPQTLDIIIKVRFDAFDSKFNLMQLFRELYISLENVAAYLFQVKTDATLLDIRSV